MSRLIKGGQDLLVEGASALEAVVWAVEALEASGLYVAGKGSAPHSNGGFELDASLMSGPNRRAGAVAAIEGIKSPIRAALAVLEGGRHVMLAGAGARLAAKAAGLSEIDDPQKYYSSTSLMVLANLPITERSVPLHWISTVRWPQVHQRGALLTNLSDVWAIPPLLEREPGQMIQLQCRVRVLAKRLCGRQRPMTYRRGCGMGMCH